MFLLFLFFWLWLRQSLCRFKSRVRDKIVTAYVLLLIAKSQDNTKDYMALTVVPEDQPASKQMELETPEDQRTKVNHLSPQSIFTLGRQSVKV